MGGNRRTNRAPELKCCTVGWFVLKKCLPAAADYLKDSL